MRQRPFIKKVLFSLIYFFMSKSVNPGSFFSGPFLFAFFSFFFYYSMNEIIKGYTAVMPQREEGKMSQFIVRFVDNSSLNIAGEIDDIFKIINSKSKFAHV